MKSLSGVLLVCCFMAVCDNWVFRLFQRTVCYEEIGCFGNASPFNNAFSFLPRSPTEIGVMYQLFTRENRDSPQNLTTNTNVIQSSNFNGSKATKFIIHGYRGSTYAWVPKMKDAILQREDANVIAVNWEKGADNINYMQAAANTRVVGALVAQMMKAFHTNGQATYHDMHLIGHSLGSHIAGYTGERVPGTGRITGLDPVGPLFENKDPKVRLDPSDVLFVDAIHTDGDNLHELGLVDGVACNHVRVLDLFTESITSTCSFQAMPCPDKTQFEQGHCTSCGHGCAKMGYDASEGNPNGTFYFATNSAAPFCIDSSVAGIGSFHF